VCDRHRAWIKQGGQLGLLAEEEKMIPALVPLPDCAQRNRLYQQW
jgi:hypothetical protein